MKNRIPLYLSFSLLLFLNAGCASIQLATVSIKEHFVQTLTTSEIPNAKRGDVFGNMLKIFNKKEKNDSLFTEFLNKGWGEALAADTLVITDGILDLAIFLLPGEKLGRFEITGGGHYDIYNKETKEIYFSSTFRLTGCTNCDDIERLYRKDNAQDSLTATFTQIAINQFNYEDQAGKKYKHTPIGDFKVHIKIKNYGKKRIGIDYEYFHPVYFDGYKIGELKFTPPNAPDSKIIDLRGLKTLLRKYKDLAPSP